MAHVSDLTRWAWVVVAQRFAGSAAAIRTRDEGQGMVEYALVLCLVSAVAIVIMITMGNQISNIFGNLSQQLAANAY